MVAIGAVVVAAIKQQRPQCSASMGRDNIKNCHYVVKAEKREIQKSS